MEGDGSMKVKTLIAAVILLLVLGCRTVLAGSISYTDVKDEWFSTDVLSLSSLGVINGYPDGTFKPNGNVQVDEFIKMAVIACGYNQENGTRYWGSTYIEKAKEIGLVRDRDFDKYTRPIVRAEIARIAARAVKEGKTAALNEAGFKSSVKDYGQFPTSMKDFIIKAYSFGIIRGYPDGEFKWDKKASRAEAAAMVVRLLDINKSDS